MIDVNFLNSLQNGGNICYLIDIKCINTNIYLTSGDIDTIFNNNVYSSGYFVKTFQLNDIEQNGEISMEIVKNDNINVEELSSSRVFIRILTSDNKSIIIFSGFISSIKYTEHSLVINVLPNIAKLNYSIGELFSPLCRECLGSDKCRVKLDDYKSTGIITSIISNDCFIGNHQLNKATNTGYYQYGIIKFLSGKLSGISMQIKDEKDGKIYLLQQTNLISINDKYEIFAGCDKTLKTCKEKFNNTLNFRGEPYING